MSEACKMRESNKACNLSQARCVSAARAKYLHDAEQTISAINPPYQAAYQASLWRAMWSSSTHRTKMTMAASVTTTWTKTTAA
eukprot:CAMPEP_0198577596 /NCGR_PEP_ID=MMETSP1462-20131121/119118_1 /TAXON_ID=1333877 /ORGANISM="Brandtodinium nutriculum, Strain RCC3387" /LENGTH=82 /DNA_ID=CAMNT_0044308879 /DNA_START=159 /DNA_END=407 /DNA_ORIENTATION=-